MKFNIPLAHRDIPLVAFQGFHVHVHVYILVSQITHSLCIQLRRLCYSVNYWSWHVLECVLDRQEVLKLLGFM